MAEPILQEELEGIRRSILRHRDTAQTQQAAFFDELCARFIARIDALYAEVERLNMSLAACANGQAALYAERDQARAERDEARASLEIFRGLTEKLSKGLGLDPQFSAPETPFGLALEQIQLAEELANKAAAERDVAIARAEKVEARCEVMTAALKLYLTEGTLLTQLKHARASKQLVDAEKAALAAVASELPGKGGGS